MILNCTVALLKAAVVVVVVALLKATQQPNFSLQHLGTLELVGMDSINHHVTQQWSHNTQEAGKNCNVPPITIMDRLLY